MNVLPILVGFAVREASVQISESRERRMVFEQAREYADQVGKPLLVVGTPRIARHGFGDVTIDKNPSALRFGNTELGDVRDIQYPDGHFGAAYVSHVLEHLPTIEDAAQALDELERVADRVFVVSPHKFSFMAIIAPAHHLWVTPSGDGYILEQRGGPGKAREESYVVAMEIQ